MQVFRHAVEGCRQHADFVTRAVREPGVETALADLQGRRLEFGQGRADRTREEQPQHQRAEQGQQRRGRIAHVGRRDRPLDAMDFVGKFGLGIVFLLAEQGKEHVIEMGVQLFVEQFFGCGRIGVDQPQAFCDEPTMSGKLFPKLLEPFGAITSLVGRRRVVRRQGRPSTGLPALIETALEGSQR